MNKRSRMYPCVRVDHANVSAVGQAGGVLLTRAVEASGLGLVLSQALGLWRKPLAKHDPAKVGRQDDSQNHRTYKTGSAHRLRHPGSGSARRIHLATGRRGGSLGRPGRR